MSAWDEARDALLHDLGDAAVIEACLQERRWWVQQWPDGEQFLVCLLAQDVQEAVRENDPTWPLCPEHRDHPLFVEPDLGTDPFWVCEKSGLPVAPVGRLSRP